MQLADFFLGDVGLSWERRKAIEFSFFTLADSGAFATHAPRRLNEALAIMRPFKLDIWPYLILTIVFSGPIFYGIIIMPYKWRRQRIAMDVERLGELCIHMAYIKEITPCVLKVRHMRPVPTQASAEMPAQLLQRCIWFTLRLFLKQCERSKSRIEYPKLTWTNHFTFFSFITQLAMSSITTIAPSS